jgi:hypothetical protein
MPPEANGRPLSLQLDVEPLRTLVRELVAEELARLQADAIHVDAGSNRLAYSEEEEAAALIGVNTHVLRDERRRGRITASSIVGRRIRYTRADLLDYLQARRAGAQT